MVNTQNATASYLPNGLSIATHVNVSLGHVQLIKLVFGAENAESIVGVGTGGTARLPVALPATERVFTPSRVTNNGTITAGAKRVSIANVGSGIGTVAGVNLLPGESVAPVADGADTLAAIAYNATGTEFLIAEVR